MNFTYTVELETSVRNLEEVYQVNLFPNPVGVGAETTVLIESKEADQVQVTVYDITGKRLQYFPLLLTPGQNINTFNAPKAAGIYVMRMVNQAGQEQSFRFSVK